MQNLVLYLYFVRHGLHLKVKVYGGWLGYAQSVETPCDELSDADLSEQS